MNAEVRMSRRSLLEALGFAGLVAGVGVNAAPPLFNQRASAQPVNQPLDLAAMMLNTSDLDELGLENFGVRNGYYRNVEEFLLGEGDGQVDPDYIARAKPMWEKLGFAEYYSIGLCTPDPTDSTLAARMILSNVIAFDPVENEIATTFSVWNETSANEVVVPTSQVYGDESIFLHVTEFDPFSGQEFQQKILSFRLQHLMVSISAAFFDGAPATDEAMEFLAAILVDRVNTALAGGYPGVSRQVAVLEVPYDSAFRSYYQRLGGVNFRAYNESPDAVTYRASLYDPAVDVYYLRQYVPAGQDGNDDDYLYYTHLARFADAFAAQTWFAGILERLSSEPLVGSIEERPLTWRLGDEALAVKYLWNGGYVERIWIRVGAEVVSVRLIHSEQLPAGAVDDLAISQTSCLVSGSCADRVSVPGSIPSAGPIPGLAPESSGNVVAERQAITAVTVAASAIGSLRSGAGDDQPAL